MTWTKLDDGIFDHPKMVKAGEDAANLYVRALVYCNRYLTDGRIDPEVLSVITRKRDAVKLAEALVRVGAWESLPNGGWLVHGFHEHNPTAEQVAARRAEISEKRSKAGKIGGKRSGEARSNEANAKQTRSKATKQNEANEPEATKQNASPVPARPVQTHTQGTQSARAQGEGDGEATREPAEPPRVEPPHVAPVEPIRLPTHEEIHGLHAAEVVSVLRSRAKGALTLAEDSATLASLQKLLRELAVRAHDPVTSLAPFEALADWYAAGSQRWRTQSKLTLRALLAPGVLVEHIEEAALWARDGRGAITHPSRDRAPTARAHTAASARRGPAPVSAAYAPDPDDDPEMLQAFRAEQKAAGR